jgi:tetratricopeptide (TPR) repeat protein
MRRLVVVAIFFAPLGFGQSGDCDSVETCQDAVKANRASSLAHFRLGEIYLSQRNYQTAANELRMALSLGAGDRDPKWIEACAHIDLGKIFDTTGQRERALNEYRLALRTKDNTRGALDEAKKYTETPYKPND